MKAETNDMEITRIGGDSFFLFFDIFVHWSGRKITAVAPYYGDDIDWRAHGVDYEQVVLSFDSHRVVGDYIPHRLDSWEPCILLDFDDPLLDAYLRGHASISFTITVGPHEKRFVLAATPPAGFDIAMSVVVRDENRWLPYFLDYYLNCLEAQHVYLYDNRTADRDGLQRILRPYLDSGRATYIPWSHRWRNRNDRKMIGQPPQQAHTLNRYGNTRWIGFFDVDEFLRIPGRTLVQFLGDYDAEQIDGLSFGLRWFMYKGDLGYGEIGNPLLSFFHCRPDSRGRKRQKLIVSSRNVRFLRLHWLEDGKREMPVDDTDIFFHHYYLRERRFDAGKSDPDTIFDDFMLGFADRLTSPERGSTARSEKSRRRKPETPEDWTAHVVESLEKADQYVSNLTDDVLSVRGKCGLRNRHFYNNLCNFEGCRYLEIGSFAGASLCAAMFENAVSAVCIENWSRFGGPRDEFLENSSRYRGASRLQLVEEDCFTVETRRLGAFNVFFYDGPHGWSNHYRAFKRFYDNLESLAVVIIDDWNWRRVRRGTRKAIAELNVPVIFEKEILLPPEDVADMPRHRGRLTWWNGVYVVLIDKQAASRPTSLRPPYSRASAGLENGVTGARDRIEVVIFSKDRACQLEALLRSMDMFFDYPHERTVLYTASNDEFRAGYDRLSSWYENVNWVEEKSFRPDLLRLLAEAKARQARYITFLCDDIVFKRRFVGGELIKTLDDDPEVLAVSLRMGENIRYCQVRDIPTTPPQFVDGRRWAWRSASPGYWNYPMSNDGHIYRMDDFADYVADLKFRNPSTLEARMAGRPIDKPYLVCGSSPFLVNLALNVVQDIYPNPHAGISPNSLNRCFLEGFAIDIESIVDKEYDSCHIEPELKLIRHRRAVPAEEEEKTGRYGTGSEGHYLAGNDSRPTRRNGVLEKAKGDALLLRRRSNGEAFELNPSGREVWSLCDGSNTVDDIVRALKQKFDVGDGELRTDVLVTLHRLERNGLIAAPGLLDVGSRGRRQIDLRDIVFYVITCKGDDARRKSMERQLRERGLNFEFIPGLKCKPRAVGIALSHMKILAMEEVVTPFAVLEDDCQFTEAFRYQYDVPVETDALYLGVSHFGSRKPGELSRAQQRNVRFVQFEDEYLRVFNMFARHAIVFLSDRFRQAAQKATVEGLLQRGWIFPGDACYAMLHASHLILTPNDPVCYQNKALGGAQSATRLPLRTLLK